MQDLMDVPRLSTTAHDSQDDTLRGFVQNPSVHPSCGLDRRVGVACH
jgi:hypothetical protein